jgi:DNA-binding IclR family transcriptional regulator
MSADYTNDSQQRGYKTLLALFGHEMSGLSPGDVAKAVGTTASNATRDLYNLVKAGLAERITYNGNYRITPLLGQKALTILTALDRADRRAAETRQRFTRN